MIKLLLLLFIYCSLSAQIWIFRLKNLLLQVIISIFIILNGCSGNHTDPGIQPGKLPNIESAYKFYDWLILESETYYDKGKGHWGQNTFGYRNLPTECYHRFDGYQTIAKAGYYNRELTYRITSEMTEYYLHIADTIGTGVWGYPAEPKHPEIGAKMLHEIENGNSKNGWIFVLSGMEGSKSGMFHIHGQVLADISRSYLRNNNEALLPYINKGARWIINENYYDGNPNYFASALKGLAYTFAATGENEIKLQALKYLRKILDAQNPNGSFGGSHDMEAGYHGIIISCLAVARRYLPENDLPVNMDTCLKNAIVYLKGLTDISTEDRAGFVVQAWYYISCLADDQILSPLSDDDWKSYSDALKVCTEKKESILTYKGTNNYIYQKEIQTASLIGTSIVRYYFGMKEKYY